MDSVSTLLEAFPKIELTEELNDYFAKSKVEKIKFYDKPNRLELGLILTQIVSNDALEQLAMRIKYSLKQLVEEVVINERYELEREYTNKRLFFMYKACLLGKFKREHPYLVRNIQNLEPKFEDNFVVFMVNHIVFDYINDNKIAQKMNAVLKEKFNQDISIAFMKNVKSNSVESIRENLNNMKKEVEQEENKIIKASFEKTEQKKEEKKNDSEGFSYGRLKKDAQMIKIKNIVSEMNDAYFEGEILKTEVIVTRKKAVIMKLTITDYTDSIVATLYKGSEDEAKDFIKNIKKGLCCEIYGNLAYDSYMSEDTIKTRYIKINEGVSLRSLEDDAPEKRIELNLHTKMSDMDGIVSAKDAVKAAMSMGHKGLAITDYAVAQSFHEACHALPKGSDFKIIYGCEMYMVDDLKKIVKHSKNEELSDSFVVFDLETTGFYARKDRITEIGAVKIKNGVEVDSFSTFVNPRMPIPEEVTKVTNITNEMVREAPVIEDIFDDFLNFVGDSVLVAHNSDFDMSFIYKVAKDMGKRVENTVLDTLELARVFYSDMKNYQLKTLCKEFNVPLVGAHRAVNDAAATAKVFVKMIDEIKEKGLNTTDDINDYALKNTRASKKIRPRNITVLVKNQKGLDQLYELITKSHLDYYYRLPKIPRTELMKFRDNLVIMSGNYNGEIFNMLLNDRDEEDIIEKAKFYDYIEVQPPTNNIDLVESGVLSSRGELEKLNKKIIEIAKLVGKDVVATGNVHFLYEEDRLSRDVILFGRNFLGNTKSGDFYFRNTEQMLDEFNFLDEDEAKKIVISNTHKVYDEIDFVNPINPDKCPPKIEGSDDDLRKMCYEKAKSIYGEDLPEIVKSRLDKELNSIISNGYSVMYIIAYELVNKSEEDGYLVGSRGSVGSSFAATMSSITEVNPLPPHYYCKKCKYSDFDSDVVKSYKGRSGFELPRAKCPNCGEELCRDGQDIPFETFLGFNGDKEPDIDLNFSGEYQSNAHKYTEELFGKENIFRAGTIGTVAEKTAIGILNKYLLEKGIEKRSAEKFRIANDMIGVRRTTGQHPGGIVVLPKGDSIYRFTPVQKPANKMDIDIITTHFDYHSIDSNLLKLDILGHDDPTIIRILQDITGIDPKSIPFDDERVLSLFAGTKELGIEPEQINGTRLGCLGVPEFGTEFVIAMVEETKPKGFSDLVRISGLSHGTDVWVNNAQELIKKGSANISEIISTRDDIMVYLISMGVEKSLAFTIMEKVRKGKGLDPDMEKAMKAAGVPDWYIWSCKQIKYMFPKAHAVAYVMMAFRIAYFKVYHKEAYYTAFFSIRASSFDYEMMASGLEHLRTKRAEILEKAKTEKMSKKDQDILKDMKVVEEMYARGVEFAPIDIDKVQAKYFQIVDGKIMPSLTSVAGLGESVALNFVEKRDEKPFVSIEDIKKRGKINNTTINVMKECGILKGMRESNQLSLFDL